VSTSQNPGSYCNIKILDKPFENAEKFKCVGTGVLYQNYVKRKLNWGIIMAIRYRIF
jgi:hypothetical protein